MLRVIGAAALLVIAGCGAPEAEGMVRAQLGREIQIRATGSPTLATLWLDSVEPVTCTEPGSLPPTRGHFLAATIVLQTSQQYEPDWGWWMSANDFKTVDANGKETGRGTITSCLSPSRYLVDDFYLSDAGYYGVVLIDSSAEHGTLVYTPHNLPSTVDGWSWEY
ncbi:hypothetical protein [Actinokineospora sp. NPDC004072]